MVSKCFVAEVMDEKKAVFFHPLRYLSKKFFVVLHVLCMEANAYTQ